MVAERCSSRERAQTCSAAVNNAPATSSTRSGAASLATEAHSSLKSMLFQGVSVPPQSKMTASIDSAMYDAHHVLHDVAHRHVLTRTGRSVLDLDHSVHETLADHDDGGHAEQLGVLELHAG